MGIETGQGPPLPYLLQEHTCTNKPCPCIHVVHYDHQICPEAYVLLVLEQDGCANGGNVSSRTRSLVHIDSMFQLRNSFFVFFPFKPFPKLERLKS